ncbi:hypothetical protein AB6A40_001654 [Gnathostoma spinigerum]|uniref:PARP n=1 Tax=Gnathostoma spinigerum TaxID=75299 RepID=A0ABD6E4N7_9BILA
MVRTKQRALAAAVARKNSVLRNASSTAKFATSKSREKTVRPTRRSTRTLKQFKPFTIPLPQSRTSTKQRRILNETPVSKNENKLVAKRGNKRSLQSVNTESKSPASRRRYRNDLLEPRPFVTEYETNPYLYGDKTPEFISIKAYERMTARCICRKDIAELRRVMRDRKKFDSAAIEMPYCHALHRITPMVLAALSGNVNIVDGYIRCCKEIEKEQNTSRAVPERVLLKEVSTGTSNYYMLGRRTARVEMSRGGREGNNALLKYDVSILRDDNEYDTLVENNVSLPILERIVKYREDTDILSCHVYSAVRYGNRKLAGEIARKYAKYGFNELHIQTLLNDNQPLTRILPISVLKRASYNRYITPLHTAAINPNPAYLKALMAIDLSYNVPDLDNWYTIHYAAVCEGPGPLKLLLDRRTSFTLQNKVRDTPLHCAARVGRVENVKLLIEAIKQMDEETDDVDAIEEESEHTAGGDEPATKKKKKLKSPLNIAGRRGWTPLHYAVSEDREEVVRLLLNEESVTVDSQSTALTMKITPLMLACQRGYKKVAEMLIKAGAVINKGDKMNRTPLIHAVMNGQIHVVSMLLRRGADVTLTDSSDNAPVHYAAAYGWLECLQLLTEADPLCVQSTNGWQLTPLDIAFKKGHIGIVEWLLDGPFATITNINSCDLDGITIISSVIDSLAPITSADFVKDIEYLLSRKADCSIRDSEGNSPLHHFAGCQIRFHHENEDRKQNNNESDRLVPLDECYRCIDLLIEGGNDVFAKNDLGQTAMHVAVSAGNLAIAEYIFAKMLEHDIPAKVLEIETKEKTTREFRSSILHLLMTLPLKVYNRGNFSETWGPSDAEYNISRLMEKLSNWDRRTMKRLLLEQDSEERTPLIILCETYTQMNLTAYQCDSQNKEKYSLYFTRIISSLCETARIMTSVEPNIVLQRVRYSSRNPVSWKSAASFALDGNKCDSEEVTMALANGGSFQSSRRLLLTLFIAALEGRIVNAFLDQRDDLGYTVLHKIISLGDKSMAVYMMQSEGLHKSLHSATITSKIIVDKREVSGVTILMMAIQFDMLEVVNSLDLTTAQWNAEDSNNENAFHYVARYRKSRAIPYLECLHRHSVEIKKNNFGLNPLHLAMHEGQESGVDTETSIIEWLISNTDCILQKDNKGRLPIHYAFCRINEDDLTGASQIDPIAFLSVLIRSMNPSEIDLKDSYGNSALHYAAARGATICCAALLNKGCNANSFNTVGNSPLAIAALYGREMCCLSLLQSKANIVANVHPRKVKEEDHRWVWMPARRPPVAFDAHSVSDICVRNNWQGIIYFVLDFIGRNEMNVCEVLCSALRYANYNLAQSLLLWLKNVLPLGEIKRSTCHIDTLNLIDVFVSNLKSSIMSNSEKEIFDLLTECNVKWWRKEGGTVRSKVVEELFVMGNFDMLEYIQSRDEEECFNAVTFDSNSRNPLVSLINLWIKNGASDKLKSWIKILATKCGINTLMLYERPAFDGMQEFLPSRPLSKLYMTTPLIHAIHCNCRSLIANSSRPYPLLVTLKLLT